MSSSTFNQTEPKVVSIDNSTETARETTFGSQLAKWLFTLVILAAAFAAGAWWANQRAEEQNKIALPPADSVATSATLVTAQPVEYREIQRSVACVGTLYGFEEPTISAKVDGRILKIHHDLSEQVAPGALLLEIDPIDTSLAVQQAERNLQVELSKLGFPKVPTVDEDLSQLPGIMAARVRADHARSRVSRLKLLVEQNAAALEELEQVQSEVKVFESEWVNQRQIADSAAALARLREADLEIARQRLSDTKVYVPQATIIPDGIKFEFAIAERLVSEGMLVRAGTELFRLVHWQTLKLKLAVPEAYSNQVKPGQSVEVSTSTTSQPVMGTVARIGPTVDRVTRTFQVEVEVPNSNHYLKPGSFARANILIGTDQNVQMVPLASIDFFAGIHKIFLIKSGVAREVKVTLGYQDQQWIEITSPVLAQGELVITTGQRILSDGSEVALRGTEDQSQ